MATRVVFTDKNATTVAQHEVSALTTTPETLSTTGVRMKWFVGDNSQNAGVTYLKFYNKAVAPVHSTDDPDLVWPIEAGKVRPVQLAPGENETGANSGELFSAGFHVIASNAKDKTGSNPSSAFACTIGLTGT